MQSFKEISYQNYIVKTCLIQELRFNPKNLRETEQQEALLKYKRNAQLLAEIFSFEKKDKPSFKAEPIITEEHLKEMELEVEREKNEGERKCQELEEKSKNYCRLLKSIKTMKTESEKAEIIKELKATDLYDECHPYFAEGSPFFMNSTDEDMLEVTGNYEVPELNTMSLFKIR